MDILRQLPNFPFGPNNTVPMVMDTGSAAPFRGGVQNDSLTVALDNMVNQGALTQDPGYLSLMNQFQPPQMNTAKFDPRGRSNGWRVNGSVRNYLRQRSNEQPNEGLPDGSPDVYAGSLSGESTEAASVPESDRCRHFGRCAAGKYALSTAGKLARDMFGKNLNELSPEEMTRLGAIAKQFSASTNISVDASQKANVKLNEQRATTAAKYEAELDAIVAGAPQTQDIISQLEILNAGIDTSGNVGNLADGINRALSSLGSSFTVSNDTTWREAYRGLSNKLAFSELQFFKGPTTDFEFGVAASINGNLDQTPEGREILLMLAKSRSRMNQVGAQAYLDWAYGYDGIPSAGKFTKSDAYKQLQLKTMYSENPGSLGKIIGALDKDKGDALYKQRTAEMTKRYKAAYPDEDEAKILQMVNQHMDLELGN